LKEHPFYRYAKSEREFEKQLGAFCERVEQKELVLPESPKYLQVLQHLLQPNPDNRSSAREALQLLQQCSSSDV
jgi:hypothetical protein